MQREPSRTRLTHPDAMTVTRTVDHEHGRSPCALRCRQRGRDGDRLMRREASPRFPR